MAEFTASYLEITRLFAKLCGTKELYKLCEIGKKYLNFVDVELFLRIFSRGFLYLVLG